MADDYRELIKKYDLLEKLRPSSSLPRPVLAEGRIPDKAQQARDWLLQFGDDPTVSDEAKQAKINDFKHEIRKRERGTLAMFLPPLVDPRPATGRRAPTTMVEPQQADPPESQPFGESGEPAQEAPQRRTPGRMDWDDFWSDQTALRKLGRLPPKKAYLDYARTRIKERYGVEIAPSNESELRRFMRAVYDGNAERPKSTERKRPRE